MNIIELSLIVNSFLVGIILVVQVVCYPIFLNVAISSFQLYHKEYINRISIIVIPAMILESITTIILLIVNDTIYVKIMCLLLFIIWLSTFFIQLPLHNRIQKRYKVDYIKKLIVSNYLRTILWVLKLGCIILIISTN